MKNAFLIVTLSLLLAGCSGMAPRTGAQPDAPKRAKAAAENGLPGPSAARKANANAKATHGEDSLPPVALTDDLLFKLLNAEITYQRGQWQPAYAEVLAAAQQTRDPRLARRATEIALSAKQSGEALSAIRLWRELAPHSEEATQYFLGVVVLSDDINAARPVFEQRLRDANPHARSALMFQTQRMLAHAKDKAAALSMLDELLKPYGSTPEAHLALAQAAFDNGDRMRAQTEARTALSIKPDSELGALMLVQAAPDKNEAIGFLASFLRAHPHARDVRITYARLLAERKQYDKARDQFKTLLKDRPEDLTSLYALGILSTQTNDLESAEKYLTTYLNMLEKYPGDERDPTQALLLLAQIAEDRNDTAGALKWLSQIESGDSYLGAQVKRAQLIAKRGDIAGARAALQALKPENAHEQAQLVVAEAQLLRDANQAPEALRVLEAGIKLYPDNADLLYDFAMMAEKSDKLDVMEATLRKVIELTPDNQHAYNALGYSLAERNIRLPEALVLIDKALKLAPDDPFIMDSMGWVHFRMGNLKEAEDYLRRAYQLRPDPEIGAHLGEVLWIKGRKADAQQLWRDAMKKDPTNITLKSTLARLQVDL
ncbi:MAG TPA: tetratricopeptide repeat protein [Burkholderiaceae bacterium]|nr:tetratricopeptide repeat protein [Burkholderiaceae bacterium]